jgi:hypothetical protein
MKRLLIISMALAIAAPALAQSQTRTTTQSQTRTSDPDSTMTETQKGGPASKESKPNAGGQQNVVKPGTTNARAVGTPPPPR